MAYGKMIRDRRVQEKSLERERARVALLAELTRFRHPALGPLGGWILIGVGVLLLVSQWTLYPLGSESQSNADRSLGVGIVAAFVGARFALSAGRHMPWFGAGFIAGVCSILGGALAGHQSGTTQWLEILCGAIVVVASVVCLTSPRRE